MGGLRVKIRARVGIRVDSVRGAPVWHKVWPELGFFLWVQFIQLLPELSLVRAKFLH